MTQQTAEKTQVTVKDTSKGYQPESSAKYQVTPELVLSGFISETLQKLGTVTFKGEKYDVLEIISTYNKDDKTPTTGNLFMSNGKTITAIGVKYGKKRDKNAPDQPVAGEVYEYQYTKKDDKTGVEKTYKAIVSAMGDFSNKKDHVTLLKKHNRDHLTHLDDNARNLMIERKTAIMAFYRGELAIIERKRSERQNNTPEVELISDVMEF
jgi:hypothetical protein